MTIRNLRYIAIATAIVALLGISLVHFDSFAAAQSNKKARAASPGKSTKVDPPSSRDGGQSWQNLFTGEYVRDDTPR